MPLPDVPSDCLGQQARRMDRHAADDRAVEFPKCVRSPVTNASQPRRIAQQAAINHPLSTPERATAYCPRGHAAPSRSAPRRQTPC